MEMARCAIFLGDLDRGENTIRFFFFNGLVVTTYVCTRNRATLRHNLQRHGKRAVVGRITQNDWTLIGAGLDD